MPTPSRRQLLKTLLVGGLTMALPLDANATTMLPKPPTINDKVLQSQYVIVGEVERIEYYDVIMVSKGEQLARKVTPARRANTQELGKLLTIRVIEAIKWDPNPDQLGLRTKRGRPKARPIGPTQPTQRIKLVFFQYAHAEFLRLCSVGQRFVFFVNPAPPGSIITSDPHEFFGTGLITLIHSDRTLPEPLDRLPEVRKAFANPEPYRGVENYPCTLKGFC